MNMKNITKSGLNEFITAKVSAKRRENTANIEKMINEKIDPILEKYVDVKRVEDAAAKFADLMTDAIEKYKNPLGSWKYSEVVTRVNQYAISLGSHIKQEVKEKIKEYVNNPQKGVYEFENDELNQALRELKDETQPLYKNISDLNKLQRDLERVIKNEPNGSRGYKALVALGVDMEGYEETGVNLPAITKLSADVCVLNGDCGKKETA